MNRILLISVGAIALLVPLGVRATETVTYTYDAQGRLVQSVISGTVNNGQTSNTSFDAANNRTNYSVSLNGGTPPSSNQPPVTAPDSLSVPRCTVRTKDVTFNDSDPEGNVPLVVLSAVNANSSVGTASVASASSVSYEAYGTAISSDSVTYTVRDSLGATATGTLSISFSGPTCSSQKGAPPPDPGGGSGG